MGGGGPGLAGGGLLMLLPLFDGLMRENALRTAKAKFERTASRSPAQLEILDPHVALKRARFNAVNALADDHSALAMWLRATGRVR